MKNSALEKTLIKDTEKTGWKKILANHIPDKERIPTYKQNSQGVGGICRAQ
jgi:hypothetical protein